MDQDPRRENARPENARPENDRRPDDRRPDDRREMYNGFGDTLARAVELTLTPAIFGFLGWWLDHRVATTPGFTLLFTLVVFGYGCWKLWSGYETSMRSHEARLDTRLGRRG